MSHLVFTSFKMSSNKIILYIKIFAMFVKFIPTFKILHSLFYLLLVHRNAFGFYNSYPSIILTKFFS